MSNKASEYVGKKLSDILPELKEYNIKLGTRDGGAFFYCGSVDKLSDILFTLNAKSRLEHETRIKNAELALNKMIERFPEPKDYVQLTYKKTKQKSAGDVMGYLNYLQSKMEQINRKIVSNEKLRAEEYIQLEDRQILDVRRSIDEEDTAIVIIDGKEVGRYWSIFEYENDMPEEDEDEEA